MRQAILNGNIVSFLIMREIQSIRKLDGTILEGSPGDVMIFYKTGQGDILSKSEFLIHASIFEPTVITDEMFEGMKTEDILGRR